MHDDYSSDSGSEEEMQILAQPTTESDEVHPDLSETSETENAEEETSVNNQQHAPKTQITAPSTTQSDEFLPDFAANETEIVEEATTNNQEQPSDMPIIAPTTADNSAKEEVAGSCDRLLRSQGRRLDWNTTMADKEVLFEGQAEPVAEPSEPDEVSAGVSNQGQEGGMRRSTRSKQETMPLSYFKLGGDPHPVGGSNSAEQAVSKGLKARPKKKGMKAWLLGKLRR